MATDTPPSPARLQRCPECGWDTSQPLRLARPSSLRGRRILATLWIIILVTALGFGLARGTKTYRFSFGSTYPELLLPPVSLDDLRRLAAGESAPGASGLPQRVLDAARQFRPDISGIWTIDVALVPPGSSRTESWVFGWPTAWLASTRYPVYLDAVRETGLQQARTNLKARPLGPWELPYDKLAVPPMQRWEWQGRELVYRRPPEETGGVFTTLAFHPPALAAPVGLVIIAWYALGMLVWWRERRKRGTRELKRIRVVAVCGLALLILGIATWRARTPRHTIHLTPAVTQVGTPPGSVYWNRTGFSRLGFDRTHVAELVNAQDGDQQLAAEILRCAAVPPGSPDSLFLAVANDPDVVLDDRSEMTTVAEWAPVLSFQHEYYQRRPDMGAPGPVVHPAGIVLSNHYGFLDLVIPARGPDRPTTVMAISPEFAGLIVVGLWVLGWGGWFVLIGAAVLRIRRRHARGLCPQCGYQVTMSSP